MSEITLPWLEPDFQRRAQDWIRAELARGNIQVSGEIEQFHVRPWSTVFRVATSSGLFYFKATGPYLGSEIKLTMYLADLYPHISPQLFAMNIEEHWLLMRDSGVPLRTFIKKEKSIEPWNEILPLLVDLQKGLAPHMNEMIGLGVMDRRLDRLPAMFTDLLKDEVSLLVDQPESLTSEEFQRLKAFSPKFEKMCARLADYGIPESLNHDDFHDGNIFLRDGRIIFTDWGDAAVTHPFLTLVVMLRGVENSLDVPPDAPQVQALRERYLNLWIEYGSLPELKQIALLAEQIGLINRALTWHLSISRLPEALRRDYAIAVPAYLKEFINAVEAE